MDIQQILTLIILALAVGHLTWRFWRHVSGRSEGCDGCGSCGKPARTDLRPAPQATPLITLGPPPKRNK